MWVGKEGRVVVVGRECRAFRVVWFGGLVVGMSRACFVALLSVFVRHCTSEQTFSSLDTQYFRRRRTIPKYLDTNFCTESG